MDKETLKQDEREILKRFVDGKKVEDEELEILEPYSTIGVVKFGFSFTRNEVQASLTKRGKSLLGLA